MPDAIPGSETVGTMPRWSDITPRDELTPSTPAPSRRRARPLNISNTERAISIVGGGLLALAGLSRRSWPGAALAGVGAALVYRGATGHSYIYERMGIEARDAPVEVRQSVTINRPPEEIYSFWRELENLPRFMRHLRSVERRSSTRSHWVAQPVGRGPALEWDSEIIEDRPNELLRWRAVPNGGIQHSGDVRFMRAPRGRGTEVHVHMEYRPPIGMALSALMVPFSKQILKEELRRFKQVLEAGEIATTEGQPSGRGWLRWRHHKKIPLSGERAEF